MNITIIIISLLFSAFFSGMELAFVSSNKLKIELDRKRGGRKGKRIDLFISNPGKYIATMLVGNNIALVIYGIFMAIALEPLLLNFTQSDAGILILQTLLSTIIILITAEFLPKSLFRINPNAALNFFSLPIWLFYWLFYPITVSTIWISDFLLRKTIKVDISVQKQQQVFGKIDLDDFLSQTQDDKNQQNEMQHDLKIFKNALDFSDIKLRECIVPRNEIVALDLNSPIETLKQTFVESGFSKIVIYKDSIDNIIGYVNALDLFKNPNSIKNIIAEIIIVPETMTANKLFDLFVKERKSIALVLDEYGGTSGMITIEDIMEEIFGEIEDEHDKIDLEEKQVNINEFILSGRLEIDYLNEKYDIDIPVSDEYETIAGFILNHHEKIPEENEEIIIEQFYIKIISVEKPRINRILFKVNQKK